MQVIQVEICPTCNGAGLDDSGQFCEGECNGSGWWGPVGDVIELIEERRTPSMPEYPTVSRLVSAWEVSDGD